MKKAKSNITKKEKRLIIFFSIALMFSICIFNQFEVFFRNQIEFGIQPQEVLLIFALFSIIVFSLSVLILCLLAHYSKKGFKIALAILFGYMLTSYIQVLFLNGHYNGFFENYAGKYKPISEGIKIVNLIVWLIFLFLPLAILCIEKISKKNFYNKLALFSSIIILSMQLVGFATAAPNADFRRYDKSFFPSIDQQLNLSKPEKENIIVFILDRTATGYVDEVFDIYPNAKKNFEGFTYYRDNIPEYGQTFPSVISMLTGQDFLQTESRSSFSKRAWQNATLFTELRKRDYTINALFDELSTYYDINDIFDKIDNIVYLDKDRIVNQWQALKSMTKLSLQRTLPYIFKKTINFDYPNELNTITNCYASSYFPSNIGAMSDERFAQKLNTLGLSANNDKNTISFVHLDCSHADDWRAATYKIFNMLGDYFIQMRKLGIYEKSTIILSADHGAGGYGRNAALFIKEKGQDNGALQIDSTSKLSNGYFLSTIFELIGADDKKPTTSYFDIIHRKLTSSRYYYDVSWDVGNHCTYYGTNKIN